MQLGSVQAALPYNSIGNVLAVIIILGVVTYAFINIVFTGKKEIGSEIEIAPNRKPYLDDEQLEGPKLDRTLTIALGTLFLVAVALPFYWILEPGRQSGAATDFNERFIKQGELMFQPTGDNLQALNCAGCHGPKGVGAAAAYNLTLPDGTIKPVQWKAPALNTVLLRYSREEVKFILTYGRPFSPMPAWGVAGGGPLNDQQVQNLIDYLDSIQLTPEQAQQAARDELAKAMTYTDANGQPLYKSEGEALFNLGLTDGFAGGAYACARCHTQGWSYLDTTVAGAASASTGTTTTTAADPSKAPRYDISAIRATSGCGALGPSLCGGTELEQFPAKPVTVPCKASADAPGNDPVCESPFQDQIDFVSNGSENGKKYGVHGQGSGKMPGFGQRPAEPALFWINNGKERDAGPGMLPPDLIEKIVEYERSR
jgi:mono/diheme cytochrome c family protein